MPSLMSAKLILRLYPPVSSPSSSVVATPMPHHKRRVANREAAKERRGKRMRLAGCQVWYADDGYFLGDSKRWLRKAAAIAARGLGRLGLSLKPWKVRRNGAEPIDFAGYRLWCARGRRVDLRKRLWKRLRRAFARYMRRRTERLARRVCSYWGWLETAVMEHQMNVKRCIFNAARAVG